MGLQHGIVHEVGDRVYVVTPVRPLKPSQDEIEEYAFGRSVIDDLRDKAPNEHIAWYGGQYVEADRPNLNGAMWLSDEVAVKSLTPMFMPVTVMHDPRSAVGLIADVKLHAPPAVPRNKIETALALWKHRFPEVVEEAEANYAQGTLMQSMECLAPDYTCSVCGLGFHKLPESAERENWCDHLKAADSSGGYTAGQEVATAVRILRNVVFTGTGLIFGTQGGTGADPEAHLESFLGEIAEFHDRAHHATQRRTTSMSETVAKTEFDRVVAERDAAIQDRDEAQAAADKLKADLEETETAKAAAEKARDEATQKVENFEEKARKESLAAERFEALGKGFLAKLGEKTRGHLREDAAAMSDEDWNKRLESVEELASVKRDDAGEGEGEGERPETGGTFSREEVAASQVGSQTGGAAGSNGAPEQSRSQRASVVAGLVREPAAADK